MTYVATSSVSAVAVHQAMIARAIKASGAIIKVELDDFITILAKSENPLVVTSVGGFFNRNYQYLSSYKGFVFFTKSKLPLDFSSGIEIIKAKKIWVPE